MKGLNGCSEGRSSRSILFSSVASTKFPIINSLIEKSVCIYNFFYLNIFVLYSLSLINS